MSQASRLRGLLGTFALALWLGGCAPIAYQMKPVAERPEQLRIEDGVDYLVSHGAQSRVRAGAAGHNAAQEFMVVLWVENLSQADQVFLPAEHISASVGRYDGEEVTRLNLHVYKYDDYLEVLKKRAESFGSSMANYGMKGHIGFHFGGASRSPWGDRWHTPRSLSHAPALRLSSRGEHKTLAHHVALEAAMSRAELYYADLALQRTHINATILKRTTMSPGETHGGVLFIADGGVRKTKDATKLSVIVSVGADVHTFSFVHGDFPASEATLSVPPPRSDVPQESKSAPPQVPPQEDAPPEDAGTEGAPSQDPQTPPPTPSPSV